MQSSTTPKTFTFYLAPRPAAYYQARATQAERQYNRFMRRAASAWIAYQDAVDRSEPRTVTVELGDYADAMDELARAAFAKWNNRTAELLVVVQVQ